MARRTNINGRFLHGTAQVTEAYDDAVKAGRLSREDADWATDLAFRFFSGHNPTILEMLRAAAVSRKVSSQYPPFAALVFANNRRFIPDDLHRLHIEATNGEISPQSWIRRVLRDEATGPPKGREDLHLRVTRILRTYFGPDWADVIRASLSSRKIREILSIEVARPDFREVFRQQLPRIDAKKSLPGAEQTLRARDPENMLKRFFSLSHDEVIHHFARKTNPKIVQAMMNIFASDSPPRLVERTLSTRFHRPTLISSPYIWHMKGILFEVLMLERQLDILRHVNDEFRHVNGTVALIRGAKARLWDGDKITQAQDFSDGLLVLIEPHRYAAPTMRGIHIQEMKSGFSGDYKSLFQVDKWTNRLGQIAQIVIPPSARVNRVRRIGTERAEDFGSFLGAIGERRWAKRKRDPLDPLEQDVATDQFGWTFLMNPDLAPREMRREFRARANFNDVLDPVFLANSERRLPEIRGELREFFENQVLDPEIQANLVAEEIEYLAVRLLELVGEELYGPSKAAGPRYVELTSQVLKSSDG